MDFLALDSKCQVNHKIKCRINAVKLYVESFWQMQFLVGKLQGPSLVTGYEKTKQTHVFVWLCAESSDMYMDLAKSYDW